MYLTYFKLTVYLVSSNGIHFFPAYISFFSAHPRYYPLKKRVKIVRKELTPFELIKHTISLKIKWIHLIDMLFQSSDTQI